MDQKPADQISRLEQRRMNIPLLAVRALLLLLLVGGIAMAIKADDTIAAALFLAAIFLLVIALLLDIAGARKSAALDDRKFIKWDSSSPEIQRQNVNVEVRDLAKVIGVGDDGLTDLLSAYIVAEDLALRQIQQEENLPLMRHVSVGRVPFDGILVDQDLITCIEVAFLVAPDIRQERIEAMLKKVAQAKKDLAEMKSRLRLRLMLVLVTQISSEEEEQLRGILVSRRFTDTPVDIDIRLLDFEMLQRVYVSE
ncbi:MAG TPA: hypothetical protein VGI80_03145 [Pyrinomonadaceae bacterium]|jgi:hypothetical protein